MAGTIIADSIQADTGSAAVSILSNTGTTVMTFGSSGNLNFPLSGQRITGDFSTNTFANRVMFQTSTVNGISVVSAIPNGTGTATAFHAFNNSDPTNAARAVLQASSAEVIVSSGITGTGTYLPMAFYTGGSERMRIDTSGNLGIGTSSPSVKLHVVGDSRLDGNVESNSSAYVYSWAGGSSGQVRSGVYLDGTNSLLAFFAGQAERARITAAGLFQFNSGYGSVATAYACRAWVNFDGTSNSANLTGTYSQTGTTVTATVTNHGLIAGSVIFSDITSGTAVDGTYTVATATDANTFTYTAGTSLTTSGNLTLRRNAIRGSGNVTSITDNGTGDYTVNFSVAMPDANYATQVTGPQTGATNGVTYGVLSTGGNPATGSVRVINGRAAGALDSDYVNVAIFR